MNREFTVRSAHDGTVLSLSNFPESGSPTSDTFLVSIKNSQLCAEVPAYSFMAPDLAEFFRFMATNWRGWSGERSWATLEGEFELAATCDSTGHVKLRYFLRPPHSGFEWELRGALELEAGQLEALAQEADVAWNAPDAA